MWCLELRTGMVESIGIVMRNQSDASDMMALAILAGELREQAGLLGSTFTPALSRHRALNDADQLKIERVLGRIEELQTLIDARISSIPELRGTIAYMDMKHLYMGDGIAYIERLRELASRGPAGAGLTTREVADAYVPLMRSITQFRDFMLDRVEQRIAAQRASSVRVLLATLAAAAMLAAALLLSLSQFRKRVIRPFVQATRIIGAIADGGPVPAIPLDRYRGEINGMFSALSVLKDTAASKSRLESERDRLILDLATMAETDFLTGLLNRRAFERRFEETRAGAAPTRCWPSSCSTSIISSPSTTPTVMPLATRRSRSSPRCARATSATPMWWRGSVARNSRSCATPANRGRRWKWPSGCGRALPRLA